MVKSQSGQALLYSFLNFDLYAWVTFKVPTGVLHVTPYIIMVNIWAMIFQNPFNHNEVTVWTSTILFILTYDHVTLTLTLWTRLLYMSDHLIMRNICANIFQSPLNETKLQSRKQYCAHSWTLTCVSLIFKLWISYLHGTYHLYMVSSCAKM